MFQSTYLTPRGSSPDRSSFGHDPSSLHRLAPRTTENNIASLRAENCSERAGGAKVPSQRPSPITFFPKNRKVKHHSLSFVRTVLRQFRIPASDPPHGYSLPDHPRPSQNHGYSFRDPATTSAPVYPSLHAKARVRTARIEVLQLLPNLPSVSRRVLLCQFCRRRRFCRDCDKAKKNDNPKPEMHYAKRISNRGK